MKDYASMSDQQINQLVGSKVGELQLGARSACCIGSDGNVLVLKGGMWTRFDPCNNPADAWPIIVGKQISLISRCANDEWKAQLHLGRDDIFDSYASCWDKNPLRAAMIVFLMMKGSENG